ncbi:MAG TPA: GTPase [Pirellulales bacterium]|nr:GTPase [Pirellulales bacterium]
MKRIPWSGSFWKLLSERVLSPRVDSAQAEEQLQRAREALPTPVIWLLGKTQSGKTSLIRALTGSTEAEIGNGFRPCTRTARKYSFPSDEECLVRFLDTRGLGEANYDPSEDIAYCQNQAHLLMVTVRAMDHAYRAVLDAVTAVRKAKPDWSVIVVQTALHDGYPPAAGHPQPYPFSADDWPNSVPVDLARSLRRQRDDFVRSASRFVAVDFTLPEDELPPELYGEDALWEAIDTEIGLGLRAMLQPGLADLYYRTAWPHILSSAVAAGGAAALPNPAVSLPLIAAIDAKMFHAIASIYGQPLTARVMGELGSAIGSGFVARLAGRSLLAMIPVVGTAFAAVYAAATTYALGRTLCWYFAQVRQGITPAAEKLRATFAKEMAEGRRRFREYLKSRKQT